MRLYRNIFGVCALLAHGALIGQESAGRLPAADQAEELIAILASKNRNSPKQEALRLLLLNRETSLPHLRQAAKESEQSIRMLALRILAEIKDPQAAVIAGESLASADVKIRRRAGTILMILKDSTQLQKALARLPVENDTGALKSLIAAIGSSGKAEAAASIRPYLRHANRSVRVNTAIALAHLGSMEGFGEIIAGLESRIDMPARREATYGLGFFSGQEKRARNLARSIINDPSGIWKGEAEISLLRLEMARTPDKLKLLSAATSTGHRLVRNWAIGQIAEMNSPAAIAWLKEKAGHDDPLGRSAALNLLLKGGN